MQGGCTCSHLRYELTRSPLFVHCCHCSWCQRESGSAFAVNVLIETDCVTVTDGAVNMVKVPTKSGRGQVFARCPKCQIALWSHYSGLGKKIAFIRAGTLDDPALCPPDIHIYTTTRQPHVSLPDDIPIRKGYYKRENYWPESSLERLNALKDTG